MNPFKKSLLGFGTLLASLALLSACEKTFDTEMKVSPEAKGDAKLILQTNKGEVTFLAGTTYKIKLVVNDSATDPDHIEFLNDAGDDLGVSANLNLPAQGDFLNVLEPVELTSASLGQPVSAIVMRDVDVDADTVGVTFRKPGNGKAAAIPQASIFIKNKGDRVAFDEKSQEFLRSYQSVRYSQRGVMFPIDGQLDGSFWGGVVDKTVNFSAAVFIAPWVYFRYSQVTWALGNDAEDADIVKGKWAGLFKDRPVVDYMAFVHGGHDQAIAANMGDVSRKKNQLRLVYTEGCESGSAYTFIEKYNAAAAIGHKATSASPFFAFPLVRGWTYGDSMIDSVRKGWDDGKFWAKTVDLLTLNSISSAGWTSKQDMIDSSELMFSWTDELPPEKLFIGMSAVPNRAASLMRNINQSQITKYDASKADSMAWTGVMAPDFSAPALSQKP